MATMYTVRWEIDVDAETPQAAALAAEGIIRLQVTGQSARPFFQVQRYDMQPPHLDGWTDVDLGADDAGA